MLAVKLPATVWNTIIKYLGLKDFNILFIAIDSQYFNSAMRFITDIRTETYYYIYEWINPELFTMLLSTKKIYKKIYTSLIVNLSHQSKNNRENKNKQIYRDCMNNVQNINLVDALKNPFITEHELTHCDYGKYRHPIYDYVSIEGFVFVVNKSQRSFLIFKYWVDHFIKYKWVNIKNITIRDIHESMSLDEKKIWNYLKEIKYNHELAN